MTTTPTTFQEALETENQEMPIIETWLTRLFKLQKIWSATIKEQREDDIDLHALTPIGNQVSLEVKIRHKVYENDLLIETISCIEKKTLGWIYKSKADFLVYAFLIPSKPVFGDVIDLPSLNSWWCHQGVHGGYPIRNGTTKTGNGAVLYETRNRVVPIDHIPFDLFHAHRRYQHIKSLSAEDEYQELANK